MERYEEHPHPGSLFSISIVLMRVLFVLAEVLPVERYEEHPHPGAPRHVGREPTVLAGCPN